MSNKPKFKPKTRRYVLEWADDHELHGLEVTMRAMRMGELEELGNLWSQFKMDDDDDENTGGRLALMGAMMDKVGKVLVAWNRPDEDTMVWNDETEEFEETDHTVLLPANADGLRKLEDWEFMAIVEGYMSSAVGVTPDLGKDWSNGASSLAELPMMDQ